MAKYIRYDKSPGRSRLDGSAADSGPKPTVTTLQIKILAEEKAALVAYCEARKLNMSEVLRELITKLLEGEG